MRSVATLTLTMAIAALATQVATAASLTGTVSKDFTHEAVGFDLELSVIPQIRYTVSGSATAVPQSFMIRNSDLNFSSVRVQKVDFSQGAPRVENYHNSGILSVRTVDRVASNLVLAGLSISGAYTQDYIGGDIDISRLVVGGTRSVGGLDLQVFTIEYLPSQVLKFGDYVIGRTTSRAVVDHDILMGQDLMHMNFTFGDLRVSGTIQFSNQGEHATIGTVNLEVVKRNGAEVAIAPLSQGDTSDDIQLRALLSFIELTSVDLTHE